MAASNANPIDNSRERLADLQENVSERLDALRHNSVRRVDIAVGTVRDTGLGLAYTASAAAAQRAARIVGALPLGESLADALSKRADTLAAREASLHAPSIEGYDELNVKQVADAVEELSAWELRKVRAYEEEHKNRKTVLGAVDRLLR